MFTMSNLVYLDNNATTAPDPRIVNVVVQYLQDDWMNPSSAYATKIKSKIEQARENIADFFGCSAQSIIFTSGATEANNQVLKGAATLAVSAIEHDSVYNYPHKYKIPVTLSTGFDFASLESALKKGTDLVSCMLVNNETGHIMPIKEIYTTCQRYSAKLHVDATQALGKIAIPPYYDYLVFSGHKIHALKGIGCIIAKEPIQPMLIGGHQERGLRPGTENSLGILSLNEALTLGLFSPWNYKPLFEETITGLRQIKTGYTNVGTLEHTFNTISFGIQGKISEIVVAGLHRHNIAVSSGSACTTGATTHSRVILELTGNYQKAQEVVRISLSRATTTQEINKLMDALTLACKQENLATQ